MNDGCFSIICVPIERVKRKLGEKASLHLQSTILSKDNNNYDF